MNESKRQSINVIYLITTGTILKRIRKKRHELTMHPFLREYKKET